MKKDEITNQIKKNALTKQVTQL